MDSKQNNQVASLNQKELLIWLQPLRENKSLSMMGPAEAEEHGVQGLSPSPYWSEAPPHFLSKTSSE